MNNWNNLENRLAGWMPRRPSRQIESTIFEVSRDEVPELGVGFGWLSDLGGLLGPIGGLAFVALVLTANVTGVTMTPSAGDEASMGASVKLAAVYDQFHHHSALNHCDCAIFGWTNLMLPGEGIALFAQDQESSND